MKLRIIGVFSQYVGLVIGVVFAFILGLIYAVLRPKQIFVNIIILVNLLGWLIYIIKFIWEMLDKRKEKIVEDDIDIKIKQPLKDNKRP